jgi:hypothetical protein
MAEDNSSGYQASLAFWQRWASVPLDIAVALVLGEDPEEFTFDSDGFKYLRDCLKTHTLQISQLCVGAGWSWVEAHHLWK